MDISQNFIRSEIINVFLSLKIALILVNSVGLDEMLHFTVLHLGIRCLPAKIPI